MHMLKIASEEKLNKLDMCVCVHVQRNSLCMIVYLVKNPSYNKIPQVRKKYDYQRCKVDVYESLLTVQTHL